MPVTKKPIQTIGPKSLISFPGLGVNGVPAKIDTGADSSAIWASGVRERDGELTYRLFDDTSQFYTGQDIITRDYEMRSVKNSFGKSEARYKVTMKVSMEGRNLKIRFGLADRSNNNYPILIGRRTLRNKFIVNVAKAKPNTPYNTLVLVDHHIDAVDQFFNKLHEVNNLQNFQIETHKNLEFGILNNHVVINIIGGKSLNEFDLIYFKSIKTNQAIAASVAHYAASRNIPFFDTVVKSVPAFNKLVQYIMLAQQGFNIPETYYAQLDYLKTQYKPLVNMLGKKFILKDTASSQGDYNFLIESSQDFADACKQAQRHNLSLVAQRYIPNNGYYRLLIFGKKIGLVIHHTRTNPATHINNVSKEARVELVSEREIPSKTRSLCLRVNGDIQRKVVSVDVVQDKRTSVWYCLGVNDSPQIATGSFVDIKREEFGKFLTRKLKQV